MDTRVTYSMRQLRAPGGRIEVVLVLPDAEVEAGKGDVERCQATRRCYVSLSVEVRLKPVNSLLRCASSSVAPADLGDSAPRALCVFSRVERFHCSIQRFQRGIVLS